jgi:putative ABC transport system permease protein
VNRRKRMLDDLDQDIRDHIEQETRDNIGRGMPPDEARFAALRKFGNIRRVKEDTRDIWIVVWFERLMQDLRYGIRMLAKAPAFTAVAILTLALGIGANTAIFSVVYAVLLKPLPFTDPGQLVTAFQANSHVGIAETGCSFPNYEEWRAQNHVFSELAGVLAHQLTLTGSGEPTVVNTSVVTPELFALLDVRPLAGRILFSEDGNQGAPPVALVSEDLWRGRFGADPKIVGSSISLDKRPFTVVGIIPAAFRTPFFNTRQEVWIPLRRDPLFSTFMPRRATHMLPVIGRLKPGVSIAQAQAEMDAISERLAGEFPAENSGWTVRLVPLQKEIVGDVRTALLVLLGAVGLVLLIACANISNLLLNRAASRTKEIAVRTALGAGRVRIVRQLLSETAVLGLLGGAAGVALAYWGVQALSSLLPADLPLMNPIRVDKLVLFFALGLSAVASLVFGLVPALFSANSDLNVTLREGGGRSGESRNRRRARKFLAAAEVSLAMILLVTSGLLLRSFSKLVSVNPGFEPRHIVKADISLPRFQYSTPQQWNAFAAELLSRIQAQPGMKDSAVAVPIPIAQGNVNIAFDIAGNPPPAPGTSRTTDYASISPEYFRVMGIPLLAGRSFNQQDISSAQPVTLISRTMAQRYFSDQDPIGKHLDFGLPLNPNTSREIIGIVGDVRDSALAENPGPMVYAPFAQEPFWGANMVVKSTLSASAVAAAIRQQVQKIDKDLPVTDVAKLPDLIDASLSQQRFRAFLLGLFGAMALLLATTGIFGVISYSVSCRTNEIGIRVALGASRGAILRMVLRETLVLAVAGLAVGLPCALAASHLVGYMLFGVSPNDPATLALVAFTLAAVSALAGFVPARRAMLVDPMVALRHE